jgi:hypothetical protein
MRRRFKYKEKQRIERAAWRRWGFLSSDQESRIRKAAINALQETKRFHHRIDCWTRRLCRENLSMDSTLILASVEENVQDLVKKLYRSGERCFAITSVKANHISRSRAGKTGRATEKEKKKTATGNLKTSNGRERLVKKEFTAPPWKRVTKTSSTQPTQWF